MSSSPDSKKQAATITDPGPPNSDQVVVKAMAKSDAAEALARMGTNTTAKTASTTVNQPGAAAVKPAKQQTTLSGGGRASLPKVDTMKHLPSWNDMFSEYVLFLADNVNRDKTYTMDPNVEEFPGKKLLNRFVYRQCNDRHYRMRYGTPNQRMPHPWQLTPDRKKLLDFVGFEWKLLTHQHRQYNRSWGSVRSIQGTAWALQMFLKRNN